MATGGLSFAKIGATDFGYTVARQFGLKIEPTRASLVPLVFKSDLGTGKLAGVSVDSSVSTDGESFRENILFTHRGLSGPATLQISNYWRKTSPVTIDLLAGHDAGELLARNSGRKQTVANFFGQYLPARLMPTVLPTRLAATPLNELSQKDRDAIAAILNGWTVEFRDTEGYDKAEVTLGGVSTEELSSKTMESKKIEGLYFIGEVVDVTGWLGGYNFQWAWASGHAAGQAV